MSVCFVGIEHRGLLGHDLHGHRLQLPPFGQANVHLGKLEQRREVRHPHRSGSDTSASGSAWSRSASASLTVFVRRSTFSNGSTSPSTRARLEPFWSSSQSASGRSPYEQARADVAETVAAERWASAYPSQQADAGDLRLQMFRGGRVSRHLPGVTVQLAMPALFAALHSDAIWLGDALEKRRRNEQATVWNTGTWEDSREGLKRLREANRTVREGLKPRNTRTAGWG